MLQISPASRCMKISIVMRSQMGNTPSGGTDVSFSQYQVDPLTVTSRPRRLERGEMLAGSTVSTKNQNTSSLPGKRNRSASPATTSSGALSERPTAVEEKPVTTTACD